MMGSASFLKTIQFRVSENRVSEKKCDWEIKEEPQPHPKRETVEEGSSRMWKGEQRQHDLDDIGRYRALVGQVDSTIAVEGLNNQDLAEYANSCRMWTGFAEIAKARGLGYNRQAPVPVLPETPKALLAAGIPNLPICHTVRHIVRETTISNRSHRHGIEPSLLASVPELLQSPVAILRRAPEGLRSHWMLPMQRVSLLLPISISRFPCLSGVVSSTPVSSSTSCCPFTDASP